MKKENIFREKLYHHTMPVRDGLWDAIEAQLPPKKEQRIFPLFWFTLFSTTLLGGALMFGSFNQDQKNTDSPLQAYVTQAYSDIKSTPSNSNDALNQTSATDTTTVTEPDITSTNKSTFIAPKESVDKTMTPASKTKINTTNTKTILTSDGETEAAMVTSSSNNQLPFHNNITVLDQQTNMAIVNSKSSSTLAFLPLQDILLSAEESNMPAVSLLKPDPNCYKFSGTGSKLAFSVDGFAGPGFSPRTFEQNSDDTSIYADARDATESNQYAWSAGARFNLQHRSGLTGRIGLSYSQVGDIFNYTDSLATQSTTRIDSFFAADGTFLYTETSQVLILGTIIKKIHNTYRYLDIPLIIGYELPMGRSTILANVGAVFNLTSSHEGQILDPMLHPRSITEGEPGAIDVYKSSVGVSLYLGAGYLFPISDDFSGLVEPTFIYRMNPVTLANYPLQERRHYAGLNVGIRYHIH